MSARPSTLQTRSAQWLLEQPLETPRWIVEDLVATGLVLLVGAPKIGKSWASLQLAISVSEGTPFLGFATQKCGVLYLCLEDTYPRIQQRLFRLTDEVAGNLEFAVAADKLQSGLLGQMDAFVQEHNDTGLIILDTFQTVRGGSRDNLYAADYADLGLLKRFADERGLAMLVVHHTRKMGSADIFDTVSGTTGITGSADETMMLTQVNRCDGHATLSVTGRDVEFSEYKLKFNDCRWDLVEKTSREELAERDVPAAVLSVLDFMATRSMDWNGTATDLLAQVGLSDVKANVLVKYLNEHSEFMSERGVAYSRDRTGSARTLRLSKAKGGGVSNG